MKKFIAAIAVIMVLAEVQGQQLWRRTQFSYNTYMINPATAGTQFYSPIIATYRQQWAGFKGAPVTYSLSGHTALPNNLGVGGIVYKDNSGGAISRTGVEVSGAYRIDLNNVDAFSFGLSALVGQYKFDNESLVVYEEDDQALQPMQVESHMNFDASAGFLVYGPTYFFGISVPQLIGSKLNLDSDVDPGSNENVRHFNIMGAYKYQLDDDWDIQSSGLLKFTAVTPVQMDIHIKVNYIDAIWGGITVRPKDAIAAVIGLQYSDFMMNYSYDLTTSAARTLSPHTHEISVGYLIPRKGGRFINKSLLGPRRLERWRVIH
ncbi:MAG: type IX secretion system membrane protein PorP/SprF [Flavobacteriales bacterium]|nr:type IX secretion system membrane protein PorP/SprF [Flavobacteriales bacterium]